MNKKDCETAFDQYGTGIAVDPADSGVVALRQLEKVPEELPQVDGTTFTRCRVAVGPAIIT